VSGSDYYLDVAYRKGYFKALLDINNFFAKNTCTLKDFRLNNSKGIKQVLKALLDGRDFMIEYGENVDFTLVCAKDNVHKVKDIVIGTSKPSRIKEE
jgi:hypothetical protein